MKKVLEKLMGKNKNTNLGDILTVPVEPTKEQLDGVSFALVEWCRGVIRPTPQHLKEYLTHKNIEIPSWLLSELDAVKTKQFIHERDILRWIYKGMLHTAPSINLPIPETT